MMEINIKIFALASLFLCFQVNSEPFDGSYWQDIPYQSHSSALDTSKKTGASCSSLVNAVLRKYHYLDCGPSDFRVLKKKLEESERATNEGAKNTPEVWFKFDHMMYVYTNEKEETLALHSPFSASVIDPIEFYSNDTDWSKVKVGELSRYCSPLRGI